jgi:hypothetical protein
MHKPSRAASGQPRISQHGARSLRANHMTWHVAGQQTDTQSGTQARSETHNSRLRGRLTALRRALAEGDQDNIAFHLNNVMRGVERLVQAWADGDLIAFEDEAWSPMQPAVRVPLRPEQKSALRATGAEDALIDELQNREMWKNELYTVMVTRHPDGWVQELSIRRNDRQAIHDWRHFQRIKTEIAGRGRSRRTLPTRVPAARHRQPVLPLLPPARSRFPVRLHRCPDPHRRRRPTHHRRRPASAATGLGEHTG